MSPMIGVVWLEFLCFLTILFVGLRLTGHIDWSWWWVISPLWMPATAALGIMIATYTAARIYKLGEKNDDE